MAHARTVCGDRRISVDRSRTRGCRRLRRSRDFVNNDYFMRKEKTGMSQVKGIETVWVNVSLKGMPKTLVGVLYISPHIQDIKAFQEEMIEFLACKQQDGLEVVLMGYFNAHFSKEGASLDCRASLLDKGSKELSLATMNWSPVATGKFTWERRSITSMLDYVVVSETWVKVIDQFLADEEWCFDVGSDHNLIFWSFGKEKDGLENMK